MNGEDIRLDELSLRYRVATHEPATVKEYLVRGLAGGVAYHDLWALRGVSATIAPGSSVGIVGRNGAGKTSLARVVSGVIKPTRGRLEVLRKVTPFLDLEAPLDRELTGLENLVLLALLLGHSKQLVRERLEPIVAVGDLGGFLHTPVRQYSAGLRTRLALSLLAAIDPEILILDEALSASDSQFRERIQSLVGQRLAAGTTLLLASHDLTLIRRMCRRCLWLDGGRIAADGETEEVLPLYSASLEAPVP